MKQVMGIAILALLVLILPMFSVSAAVSCHSPTPEISTSTVSSSGALSPCGVLDCLCGCITGKSCCCQNKGRCTWMISCARMGTMSF
ncbi:MAG TPA: hypothetical protein VN372_15085 [Methanospirillum sp.]|nr:hypothetical protein [Methanospirillum sp.]